MPKRGFVNPDKKEFAEINLDWLKRLIETGRIDAAVPITAKSFMDAGVNGIKDGVKILGGGYQHFDLPIEIYATRFTRSAIEAIEKAGGKAVSVWHSKTGLRQMKNPERVWRKNPVIAMNKLDLPTKQKDKIYYTDPTHRGYLAKDIMDTLSEEFKQKYHL